MHRSMLFAFTVCFGIGSLASTAHALAPPISALAPVINGYKITPGPGVTGITSDDDTTSVDMDNLFKNLKTLPLAARAAPTPSCNVFWPQTNTSEIQALQQYLTKVPTNQTCAVQGPQYTSNCGGVICVSLASTASATLQLCLSPTKDGSQSALSFADFSCGALANYVQAQINACGSSGKMVGFTYIDPNDYLHANNAAGTNYRSAQTAWILSGKKI